MHLTSNSALARSLRDKEARHLHVGAQISQGLPFQIRALREARNMTQAELAGKIGTTQNSISRLEGLRDGQPSITTLKRLAEAFDVALLVRFVPFSDFVTTIDDLSQSKIAVPSYEDEVSEEKSAEKSGERGNLPEHTFVVHRFSSMDLDPTLLMLAALEQSRATTTRAESDIRIINLQPDGQTYGSPRRMPPASALSQDFKLSTGTGT